MNPGEWPASPGIQFLLGKFLRRDELCHGPNQCKDATAVVCGQCGLERDCGAASDDPGPCSRCGASADSHILLECEECPLVRLNELLNSNEGILIHRALSFDFALRKPGMAVRLDEIPADVYRALQILDVERASLEAERDAREQVRYDAGQA